MVSCRMATSRWNGPSPRQGGKRATTRAFQTLRILSCIGAFCLLGVCLGLFNSILVFEQSLSGFLSLIFKFLNTQHGWASHKPQRRPDLISLGNLGAWKRGYLGDSCFHTASSFMQLKPQAFLCQKWAENLKNRFFFFSRHCSIFHHFNFSVSQHMRMLVLGHGPAAKLGQLSSKTGFFAEGPSYFTPATHSQGCPLAL